ncbi:NLI interacting factor-like phosphatase-domain-containing protein [Entophlyctis helioformis]|nr:NLI interacting factor-like phosphatase-domain-containing protein [Entophlyctis helioformis]
MASTSTGTATGSRRGAARRTCLGELQRTMGNILGLLVPSYARRRQGGSRLRAASAAEGAGDAGGGKDVYYSGSEFESGGYSSGSGSDGEAGGHGIGRLGGNGSNGGMGSDADSPLSGELGLAATARPRRSPRIRKRLNGSDPLNDSDSASTDSPADELHSSGKAKANGAGTSDRRKRRPRGSTDSSSTSTRDRRRCRKKKTLVLDLDETLIHSTSRGSRRHDFMVEVLIDKHVCLYYVYKRPYADLFLRKAAEWFKIVIFTASMPEYADPVIDWLDANRTIISKRYFRQSCTPRNGTFMKNLEIVESDLSQVALVDNSPFSYALNQDNGIPIDTWIDDPNDEALLDLLPFLDALRFADDVRSVLSLRL